jgi:transcriptional regulator with PAS, ATPase and Fis domain
LDRTADLTLTDIRVDAVDLPGVRLTMQSASGHRSECSVGLAPVVVGSGAECDLRCDDPRVSRRHLELRQSPRGLLLRDLDSKNGTFVDRVRVEAVYVDPAHEITIGTTKLRVHVDVKKRQTLPLSRLPSFGAAIGTSVQMRALFALLARVAATHETVLLLGESGTGKELLARAIHDASPRAGGPFAVLDCSATVPTLMESELFGYVRGAFTGAVQSTAGVFEAARGGTVFIDELGELPLDLQPKLLRALESRQIRRVGANEWTPIDVRIVAATHRDLRARVADGTFRMDLYYRLAVVEGLVPPLRERREDIDLLVQHFLQAQGRSLAELPPNTLAMLRSHDWPGNVRELRNTITRLLLFPEGVTLEQGPRGPGTSPLAAVNHLPLREAREIVVERFEQQYLSERLAQCGGNVSRAAEAIGVSRQFLHRLLERHGIAR